MKKNIGLSLVVLALMGLVWGALWGPLAPTKDRVVTAVQQRITLEQQKIDLREIINCVDKNPNVTLVDVSFNPDLSLPAPKGRVLLLTIAYTVDLSIKSEVKQSLFGEGHRILFACALNMKTQWDRLQIYYLDFTPIYVIDDTKTHISASISMSIGAGRQFIEQAILEKDMYSLLMASVGMAGEEPEAPILLSDMRGYSINIPRKLVNGNVDLALKRYYAVMPK